MVQRYQLETFEDVDDQELAQVDDELGAEEALFNTMGGADATAIELDEEPDQCPFELGIAQPRAISLLKLYELTNQNVPASIRASLGSSNTPVIFLHQITPFSRFGYPPTRVWGLGYQITDLPSEVVPVDFAPKSSFYELGKWKTDVNLSFSAEGKFTLEPEVGAALNLIPGVNIQGLSYGVNANNSMVLNFAMKLVMLKIQAGIVGNGVRWDFIEQDERMDRSVTLLQSALIPESAAIIDMNIRAWVRRRRFFGLGAARSWLMPPQQYEVNVEK